MGAQKPKTKKYATEQPRIGLDIAESPFIKSPLESLLVSVWGRGLGVGGDFGMLRRCGRMKFKPETKAWVLNSC